MISVDEKRETLSEFLNKEPMPWTHWFNGPIGPIIRDLNVQSYPTIYVLDAKGVIRYKDVREKLLDQAVDALLKGMERKKGLRFRPVSCFSRTGRNPSLGFQVGKRSALATSRATWRLKRASTMKPPSRG